MKNKLKNIWVSPQTPLETGESGLKQDHVTYNIDEALAHLSEEARISAFKKINKFAKNHKNIIVTKGGGADFGFTSLQINSAANKKNVLSFPEPSLCRIYYRTAIEHLECALQIKFDLLEVNADEFGTQFETFVEYIRYLSTGCILSISSLEAFMNSHIGIDTVLEINGEDRDKFKLEYLDFNTKITQMMPQILGKSFHADKSIMYGHLSNCNALRDDFIHPKKENNANRTIYNQFMKRCLDANIKEIAEATFEFVNYYEADYFREFNS